jgi:flagellar hook assembly protein FlgD
VNLASASTIKIYTIMGELVAQLESDSQGNDVRWDVRNEDGDNVASGVYIYQIKNSYSEKRGKLIIIR